MAGIKHNILELVGETPLLELHHFEEELHFSGRLLAKLEVFNPTGSVKDRIAREMIEQAEKDGRLRPGGTIVEATSGNTGIGIAAIAAAKGYHAIIVMPDTMSRERIQLLNAYGAKVVLTPGELNMPGAGKRAAEILASLSNGFMPGQGGNPDNPAAHIKSTGPEIWRDTEGQVDILVATVGTGGTISGAGRYLKEKNPRLQIVAVEPSGSAVLSGGTAGIHKIQGIGGGMIAPVTDTELFDEIVTVTDEDAYAVSRDIARKEGITVGISAGAAWWTVLELAKRPENTGKTIVTVFPDSGERYLSADLCEGNVQS